MDLIIEYGIILTVCRVRLVAIVFMKSMTISGFDFFLILATSGPVPQCMTSELRYSKGSTSLSLLSSESYLIEPLIVILICSLSEFTGLRL